MPRLESSIRSASTISAMVAFGSALGPVYVFHHNRGPVAIAISLVFSLLAAMVAFFAIAQTTRGRLGQMTPVLGAGRGASAAVVTYMTTLVSHFCAYHGEGAFWPLLLLTVGMGMALFGWVVATIGAMVGVYCEKTYFQRHDPTARSPMQRT